jgi:hypothetical protein
MKFIRPQETDPEWMFGIAPEVFVPLALAGLGLAALALLMILARYRVHRQPHCQWQRRPWGRTRITRWECGACGVDAFTSTGRSPRECKRPCKEVPL